MAITYVVGIPRSGKTYYVMYQLWKYFVYSPKENKLTKFLSKFVTPKHHHDYDLAYTNINQFDFSKSDKIKKLDFDDLREKLSVLYAMYMAKDDDSKLIEKAKEFNLNNVLITIDEVHNYLGDKVDEVLKWWLTYHGHLHQDLFFITQDLALVNSKYKANAEFFYKAIPPSARLFTSKFRYVQYRNSRMANNGAIADFTLPAMQEIYNMYVSGAENKSKSVVQKFLFIGLIFSILLIVFVSMFLSSFGADNENVDTNSSKQQISKIHQAGVLKKNALEEPEIKEEKNKTYFFEVDCISLTCKIQDKFFPMPLLIKLLKDNEPDFYYNEKVLNVSRYYIYSTHDYFSFLDFGVEKDEKNNKKRTNNDNPLKLF